MRGWPGYPTAFVAALCSPVLGALRSARGRLTRWGPVRAWRWRIALRRLSAAVSVATAVCMVVTFGDAVAPVATPVTVSATQPWTDTGIDVSGSVSLRASGTIDVGGPEGNLGPGGSQTGCITGPSSYSGQWVADGFPCWSLIGRVGNGQPFKVGTRGTFKVASGRCCFSVLTMRLRRSATTAVVGQSNCPQRRRQISSA
jgi:hypothetical protein